MQPRQGAPIRQATLPATAGRAARLGLLLHIGQERREVVHVRRQVMGERNGLIIEVHGQDGAPPFLVRWRDGKESIFFPSSDTVIEHHPAGKAMT